MLGQRLRRWANIKTSLFLRVVFAGEVHAPIINPYSAEISLYTSWRPKGYLQFENIRNVLDSSF